MKARDLAIHIARIAGDKKAEKPVILNLSKLAAFCDFFVIMTGTSGRHIAGLAEAIEETLAKEKTSALFGGLSSRNPESGWIVLDYANVVVHIFQKPQREFYSLEHLWQDAKRVRIPPADKTNERRKSPRKSPVRNKRLSKNLKSR
ncbi:MAG: ribosome silencing factor [Candidatus Omnitrophota bacterium]